MLLCVTQRSLKNSFTLLSVSLYLLLLVSMGFRPLRSTTSSLLPLFTRVAAYCKYGKLSFKRYLFCSAFLLCLWHSLTPWFGRDDPTVYSSKKLFISNSQSPISLWFRHSTRWVTIHLYPAP